MEILLIGVLREERDRTKEDDRQQKPHRNPIVSYRHTHRGHYPHGAQAGGTQAIEKRGATIGCGRAMLVLELMKYL